VDSPIPRRSAVCSTLSQALGVDPVTYIVLPSPSRGRWFRRRRSRPPCSASISARTYSRAFLEHLGPGSTCRSPFLPETETSTVYLPSTFTFPLSPQFGAGFRIDRPPCPCSRPTSPSCSRPLLSVNLADRLDRLGPIQSLGHDTGSNLPLLLWFRRAWQPQRRRRRRVLRRVMRSCTSTGNSSSVIARETAMCEMFSISASWR